MGPFSRIRAAAGRLQQPLPVHRTGRSRHIGRRHRRAVFEWLEARQLLSVMPLTLADTSFAGASAFGESSTPSMSADGQLVVFQSKADNLVPNDTNGYSDVFVYNRATNAVTLVSVALDGTAAGDCNQYSNPVISPDGRYVAFESSSSNPLVAGKSGNQYYLRDLTTATTTLLTTNASGNGNGCADVDLRSIIFTGDSKHVLFLSDSSYTGTSPGDFDHNLTTDVLVWNEYNIFERDLETNQTKLVSADMDGKGVGVTFGGYLGVNYSASADGRFVTFVSDKSTYAAQDANGTNDVFLRDVQNGTTMLVSGEYLANTPAEGDSGGAVPTISADGRYIVFVSTATNLTPVNSHGGRVAYVRDMQSHVTSPVSVLPDGTISSFSYASDAVISADGGTIAFSDSASLLPQVTNNFRNVYAYDRVSQAVSLVSVNAAGTQGGNADAGTAFYLSPPPLVITPDGRFVLYRSDATDLVSGVTVGNQNLYERDLTDQITKLVSAASCGCSSGDADSDTTVVSSNGRYVAFQSSADNLVASDGNHRQDVFVRDVIAAVTNVASARSELLPPVVFAENGGRLGAASADGRYVVFTSQNGSHGNDNQYPSDFLPDQNIAYTNHVMLRDTQTGAVSFVDVDTSNVPRGGDNPTISADGRFVYFASNANLDGAHPNTTESEEIYVRDLTVGVTTLVTRSITGGPANVNPETYQPWSVSADGRYVVFNAVGTSMVSGMVDHSGGYPGNVFIADRTTGIVKLVSHISGSTTESGNGFSRYPIVSANGLKVAFTSRATNLRSGVTDTNNSGDLFVYDVATETVSLASVNTAGTGTGDSASGDPDVMGGAGFALSSNGGYLFFNSNATNLVADDANSRGDIFRRDLVNNVTILVSAIEGGTGSANGISTSLSISSDGSRVAFQSDATNLLSGFSSNNGSDYDVYVRDLDANGIILNTTRLVSTIGESEKNGGNDESDWPVLSPDGRYVAFTSAATDLVPGFVDANAGQDDLFVRDLQSNTTVLVTANQAGTAGGSGLFAFNLPDIRRFAAGTLFFNSSMPDLTPGDRNRFGDAFSFTPAGAGIISGKVFADEDGSGTLDAGETGMRDWTVYLDNDNDSSLDPGETRLQTDASGSFAFNNLATGSYTLRAKSQTGYVQSTAAALTVNLTTNGQIVAGQNFGEQVEQAELVVAPPTAPPTGRVGGTLADVTWTVSNNGTYAAGSWQDAIYLSATPYLTSSSILLSTVSHEGGLAHLDHYVVHTSVSLPAVAPGDYYLIVETDRRNQIVELSEANNVGASAGTMNLGIPVLTLGVPSADAFSEVNQSRYYQITVEPGRSLTVALDSAAAAGSTELYYRLGELPTPFDFVGQSVVANQPDQQLLVPTTQAGTYYVLALSRWGAAATGNFTITASLPGFALREVSPNTGGNTGRVTVAVHGSDLTSSTQFSLVSGTTTIPAAATQFADASVMYATFDLTGQVTGSYDVQVTDAGHSATLPGAFTVVVGTSGSLSASFSVAGKFRVGREYPVIVDYTNNGNTDLVAPFLTLSVDEGKGQIRLDERSGYASNTVQFLAISHTGEAGLLRPGQHDRMLFWVVSTTNVAHDPLSFQLEQQTDLAATINWDAVEDASKSGDMASDTWHLLWNKAVAEFGSTIGTYNNRLAGWATYLSQLGVYTGDVARLTHHELLRADDVMLRLPAITAVDASVVTPGLALNFSRVYKGTMSGRDHAGFFTDGWSTNWDWSVQKYGSSFAVKVPSGGTRYFTLQRDGETYQGLPGDEGTWTPDYEPHPADPDHPLLLGGTLQEKDGTSMYFRYDYAALPTIRSGFLLAYIKDANGRRITANYDLSYRLASLSHSGGASLTFAYDTIGRIQTITDSTGRVTTYGYTDPGIGAALTSVITHEGTTTYTYDNSTSLTGRALTSITLPGGAQKSFQYDSQGRVSATSFNGGAGAFTYVYDAFDRLTITDATGAANTVLYTDAGQVAVTIDPLGRITRYSYGASGALTGVVTPAGNQYAFGYDEQGGLASILDPLGHEVSMTYDETTRQLASFTDARGNTTSYSYDDQGDLRAITYPDSSQETFTYDPLGNLAESINRRGHATDYAYDPSTGFLTRVTYADHTHQDYTYDAHGNMLTASDANGTITLQYDSSDRLTRISYPGAAGRFLQFTYDEAGRRTRSLDQDGFTVNYQYDVIGHLQQLTDGSSNLIAGYAYDAAGRLIGKTLGNGTYAAYTYDVAGQLTQLVNHAPRTSPAQEGAVNSFFEYTYDADGRCTSMTTADGTTTYGYDTSGQLTQIDLPGGRTIRYQYDAAGNRTSVTDNGVTTIYVANALNEYTAVGGTTYAYDADGNLVSMTDGFGTTTYAYNDANRLVSQSGPSGAATYEYNALGDRTAVTLGVARTEYLVDPTGLGTIVGEYGPGNTRIASYVNGLGLVSRVPGGNYVNSAYYDFDAVGNTVGLTDTTGTYVNRYSYLPFGETTVLAAALSNSFTFGGLLGVQANVGTGIAMRARVYDTATGQFTSNDPLGLAAGDFNFRRYVANAPTMDADPSGLESCGDVSFAGQLLDVTGWLVDQQNNRFEKTIETCDQVMDWSRTAYPNQPHRIVRPSMLLADENARLALKISKPMGTIFSVVSTWSDASEATANFMEAFREGQSASERQAHLIYGSYKGLKTALDVLSVVPATAPAAGVANLILTVGVDTWLEDALFPKDGKPTGSPQNSESVTPCDPNDIIGPAGYGPPEFVTPEGTFPYVIRFFNDPEKASAPAQDVIITQTLDADLDWSTFQLSSIMFGSYVVNVPTGLKTFRTSVDATNMDGSPLRVDITAELNLQTGVATWTFRSIDPATGTFPLDADAGFLPVNDSTGRGLGGVMYLVDPKRSLSTGALVSAQASIVFDTNAPLATNTYVNTIDAGTPTSHVLSLPASAPTTCTVSWVGSDDDGGSGIASFDVYVSDNGGEFTLWQDHTVLTSAVFTGQIGHTYGFKSVARDNVGHVQAIPSAAQGTVSIVDVSGQLLFDAPTGILVVGGTSVVDTVVLAPVGTAPTATLQVTLNKKVISKTVPLSAIQQIRVLGQGGNDTFTVSNLSNPISVEGGDGDDTTTLKNLTGPVTVDGGAGTDKLLVTGLATANTFALNTTTMTVNGVVDKFSNLESLTVNGAKAADTFTVVGLPGFPVTFAGGGGTDKLQGPNIANNWAITAASKGTLNNTISFAAIPNLTGGTNDDTFAFSPRAKLTGRIDGGGGGSDTINYANYGATVTVNLQTSTAKGMAGFANIEAFVGSAKVDTLVGANQISEINQWNITGPNAGTVRGTAFVDFENLTGGFGKDAFSVTNNGGVSGKLDGGKDTTAINDLVGSDQANVWALAGSNAGKLNGTSFANIQNLTGGAQADAFVFAKGAKVSGRIDGSDGRNRLDYSAYTTSVIVDLSAGTATGTSGIANIQDVTGGRAVDTLSGNSQDNVLIGGGGNDTLAGRDGRDLLFGGDGLDTIWGSTGEDLLFNGRTTFDTNWTVLDPLRNYWTGPDSFPVRTQQLAAGSVPGLPKLDSLTVTNDTFVDGLFGDEDADWFFAKTTDLGKDLYDPLDPLVGDRVN
jgi:RHS repeat-associated protein